MELMAELPETARSAARMTRAAIEVAHFGQIVFRITGLLNPKPSETAHFCFAVSLCFSFLICDYSRPWVS